MSDRVTELLNRINARYPDAHMLRDEIARLGRLVGELARKVGH